MIEIPLVNGAKNSHQIQFIQIGDMLIEMRINWRTYTKQWVLDVYSEGNLIAAGVTLKVGCDIFAPLSTVPKPVYFVGEEATLDNLGKDNKLVYYG